MTEEPHSPPAPFRSLKRADWPEIDRALLDKALAPGTMFEPGGPASDWRAPTLETVVHRYGVYLHWGLATGRFSADTPPIDRVSPETIKAFVADYGAHHASVSTLGVLHGVHEALRVIVPKADLGLLKKAVRQLKKVAKPRPKLPRMADPQDLYQLAQALIAHGVQKFDTGHMPSALAIRDGCVILFLMEGPLRRINVAALRLGDTIISEPWGYRVAFGPKATKNRQPIDIDLVDGLAEALDVYVKRARPVLLARSGGEDGGRLWLGAEGAPISGKALSRHLRQLIAHHLGPEMSMHLFRDAATTFVARTSGAEIGIASDVLGHTSEKTTERYYNQAGMTGAAKRHQLFLEEQKRPR